ncbi:lipid-A-disaccharide synthase [Phreatobacter cathodiphilus]|uniref:Lipid-A-disaccharide synthase n=1 Tax=Phreatobacter cathodiphilus TaxID=1868589 RepID=A0A2S0NA02_9HYPH|nr:lipid-A-disaccharide synthase [Phreatobacter cathodiphilus]AVO44972.1 lipid-A-disaccharide synthase [Phreatobacter cathodiphilus]
MSALDVFIVAGEESGDQLGAHLMDAVVAGHGGPVAFRGVGGRRMEARGLASRFPMAEIALFGLTSIIVHIPRVLRRIRETVAAILERPPAVLVLIDAPGFNRRVARHVRRSRPDIPIVFYVSPTVWAWRPGRAAEMRPYVDHLLALLPFEPEVHRRLGGPPTTYVGHPISERLADIRPGPEEALRRDATPPRVLVLPGSRRNEIIRLSPLYAAVLARVEAGHGPIDWVLPAVAQHRDLIAREVSAWPVKPRIVEGEAEKFAAFRSARAALACSGTVTLELAVAGVPQVVAYRTGWLEAQIARRLITAETAVLANLVIGEKVVPEFLQEYGTVEAVSAALAAIIAEGPERQRQVEAFAGLDAIMGFADEAPSVKAARIVLAAASQ